MKLKLFIAAISLLTFSGMATGFDLGKALQEQLKKSQAKPAPAPAQPAPATQPGAPAAPAPQASQGVDTQALAFGLFGKYSTEDEMRIGKQIAGNLLGAVPLVKDETLQRYVNMVGSWVALQSGRNDIPWRFGVLDTEDINAFAAPGGYVFITKGLYRQLNNEAELAGVLGHEIAHITKKHHLKVLKQSSLISALGTGRQPAGQGQRPTGAEPDRKWRRDHGARARQGCRIRGGPGRRGICGTGGL